MADVEASKLNLVNFKLISQMYPILMWLAGFQVILEHKEKAKISLQFSLAM